MDAFKTSGLSPSITETAITEAEPGALPSIIAELARLQAIALARIVSPASPASANKIEPAPEPLPTLYQAAALVALDATTLKRSPMFKSARRKLGPSLRSRCAAQDRATCDIS